MGAALMTLHRRPGTQGTSLSHTHSSAPENVLSEGLTSSWETSGLPICLPWCLKGGGREGDFPLQQSSGLWLIFIDVVGRQDRIPQPIWTSQQEHPAG